MQRTNIYNVNWSSKTWFTRSLYFDSSVWRILMARLVLKTSICVLVFPTYRLHSSASLCLGLSSPSVSIRIRSFVSSALQLFASTASAEYLCPIVSGCVRFITDHVATPSSFVHVCVFVSGTVIHHESLARRTFQFWCLCRPYECLFSVSPFLFSPVFSFFVENVFCTCVWKSDFNFCHRLTWSKSYIFLHSKIGFSFLSK